MLKNNKKLHLPPDFFHLLRYKSLLLDTSFFGDCAAHPEIFADFVDQCRKLQLSLVTNTHVIVEFFRGFDTQKILDDKKALVKNIATHVLAIESEVFASESLWLVEQYGQMGSKVSTTDFLLAAQTKIHAPDVCLITKNPKDFPRKIFALKTSFLLQLERELQVYAVLQYNGLSVLKSTKTRD